MKKHTRKTELRFINNYKVAKTTQCNVITENATPCAHTNRSTATEINFSLTNYATTKVSCQQLENCLLSNCFCCYLCLLLSKDK